jgi:glycosyltransferase involved in cell wall biosynthesis
MAQKLGVLKQCNFIGEVPTEFVPNFFNDIDIFVLPSRKESFGVVIIEAMASGVPVISTACGGPEFIITQQTGLIVEKDNSSQLKDSILQMKESLDKYNPEKIRNEVVQKYGSSIFCKSFSETVNLVINKKDIL